MQNSRKIILKKHFKTNCLIGVFTYFSTLNKWNGKELCFINYIYIYIYIKLITVAIVRYLLKGRILGFIPDLWMSVHLHILR